MEPLGNDRWQASFTPDRLGRWQYTIVAWIDRLASWRHEIERKVDGGQTDLDERARRRGRRCSASRRSRSRRRSTRPGPTLPARPTRRRSAPLELIVDRERARFGAWYELFPRSFGGFAGVEEALPELAALGFDVALPPADPPDRRAPTARARTTRSSPSRAIPGSPWAIGGEGGGHTAVASRARHARRLRPPRRAARTSSASRSRSTSRSSARPTTRGSPSTRTGSTAAPTGRSSTPRTRPSATRTSTTSTSTREDWRALWEALRDVVLFWVGHGVSVFRVDNPHTKPVAFWEWLIREVQAVHPDVIFLAEAFTRPAMMATLAKAGFSQSYTYFTWRNTKAELEQYVPRARRGRPAASSSARTSSPTRRTSSHEYLQRGGRPAFEARLVLAATLSPSYGIYSGFESCENVPVGRGQRGVPRLGEVRAEEAPARRPAAAARRAAERDPARETRRSSASTTSRSSRPRTSS